MKASEIVLGGLYAAKVNGKIVTVRVDSVRKVPGYNSGSRAVAAQTVYDVTNLATGRKTTFRSAAKFRSAVKSGDGVLSPANVKQTMSDARDMLDAPDTGVIDETDAETVARPEATADRLRLEERAEGEKRSRPTPVATGSSATDHTSAPSAAPSTASNRESGATATPKSKLGQHLAKKPAPSRPYEPPHVVVVARAGTGKTTTMIEGLKDMRGCPTSITPSEQQEAVWKQLRLSEGARFVGMTAFNRSIATELQNRVPHGVDAMTMHSLGFKAVRKAFPSVNVEQYRTHNILEELLDTDIRTLRKTRNPFLMAVDELVRLVKVNLVPLDDTGDYDDGQGVRAVLDELASYYDVGLNDDDGNDMRDEVYALVPRVVEHCRDVTADNSIDYNDMIWLPVALGLPVFRYNLLIVDEAQDLNRCQQALARMAGDRLIFIGDPAQAIYGFAGADCDSIPRTVRELGATRRGCEVLPLTVTRRCGRAIVEEAKRIVPDFAAHEDNPPGLVRRAKYTRDRDGREIPFGQSYLSEVKAGDMCLCRVNAPLVSQCMRLLRRGVKAYVQGRDIGASIIRTIEKFEAESVTDLVAKTSDWLAAETKKENAKRNPSEDRLISLQDRADCILAFTEGADSVSGVMDRVTWIFSDTDDRTAVRYSSIHKAKGLEARRVFFLRPKGAGCPHPMASSDWQRAQEQNLLYVAITRAIEELVHVS